MRTIYGVDEQCIFDVPHNASKEHDFKGGVTSWWNNLGEFGNSC